MQQCFSWVCDLLDLLQRTGTVDWCTASYLSKRSQGQFPCSISKLKLKSYNFFKFIKWRNGPNLHHHLSLLRKATQERKKKSKHGCGVILALRSRQRWWGRFGPFLDKLQSCNSLTLTLKYWSEGDNEIAFSNKWAY